MDPNLNPYLAPRPVAALHVRSDAWYESPRSARETLQALWAPRHSWDYDDDEKRPYDWSSPDWEREVMDPCNCPWKREGPLHEVADDEDDLGLFIIAGASDADLEQLVAQMAEAGFRASIVWGMLYQ